MHPVLFIIPIFGGIEIHTYGVLVATGFMVGMLLLNREAARRGENPEQVADLAFYIIAGAIVGARIAYVIFSEPEHFLREPLAIFRIWEGGLVFYGGLIGAAVTTIWYTRRRRLRFWLYADILAPVLALGHSIGRLGCLMAGCCYGRAAPLGTWWAITFPAGVGGLAPVGTPLYPTQLMESMAEFVIFLFLMLIRRRTKFEGQLFIVYLMIYSVVRSILEMFRGDTIRGFIIDPWLSTSQAISVVVLIAAMIVWWRRSKSAIGRNHG